MNDHLSRRIQAEDLDAAFSHEEERRSGRRLLVDGFTVPVASFVRAAGEPRQLRPAEFLEECDLSEEIDEVTTSLARRYSGHWSESGERRDSFGVQ